MTTRLTGPDRSIIAKAREMAALGGLDAICAYTGKQDTTDALAAAFGRAQGALDQMAALAERLAGDPS